MNEITYQIHWLALTVKSEREDGFNLYENLFKKDFGPLEDLGNGGRGFKEIYNNSMQMKLYLTPSSYQPQSYWHFEIPGRACELILPNHFLALGDYLESNFKQRYSITRLDFAFDHVPFIPEDIQIAIQEDKARTLAKRDSLHITGSPFAKKDNGELGTHTVEFGSNYSDRMITVYDRRGYTRLEFQCKDKRSQLVGQEILLSGDETKWFGIALSHLRDYIDFHTSWWDEFVSASARAFQTVSNPCEVSTEKLVNWLNRQVSPALSVAVDILPQESIDALLRNGRRRRGLKWNLILNTPKNCIPNSEGNSDAKEETPGEKR